MTDETTLRWHRHGAPIPDGWRLAEQAYGSHHNAYSVLIEKVGADVLMQTTAPLDTLAPRLVVGLTGLAGSGKSTVADLLCAVGFRREKFAGPLKDMMRALGLGEAEIEGDRKEAPCDLLCGATPRHAMQTLGTQWGRMLIHPDLWVTAWKRRAADGWVVADDCRFVNEAAAIRSMGGVIVRVERPGLTAGAHQSEQEMAAITPNHTIDNAGSLADLCRAVDALVADLLAKAAPL